MAAAAKKQRGMSKAEYRRSFPLEDVTCAQCGNENCLLYPAVDGHGSKKHQPTTICPDCSTPASEALLRFLAERDSDDFELKAIRVFPDTQPGDEDVFARMQKFATELADGEREALEIGWHATAKGSNCTGEFGCAEDGGVAYFDGGPKPSYALAMLFDFENFMRGADTALDWASVVGSSSSESPSSLPAPVASGHSWKGRSR